MKEMKKIYIAPDAELMLFMPVEGIAYDDSWLRGASDEEDPNSFGPGVDIGGMGGSGDDFDGEEGPG